MKCFAMKSTAVAIALSLSCFGYAQSRAEQNNVAGNSALFGDVSLERMSFNDTALNAVLGERTSADARIVQVKFDALNANTQSITLNLGGKLEVIAALDHSYTTDEGLLVWQGTARAAGAKFVDLQDGDDRAANEVTLVRNGKMVTGNIRIFGQLFQVRPLFDGNHVLYAVNELLRESDHGVGYDEAKMASGPVATVASKANTVIRTMVVITATAKAQLADPIAYVTTAFSETNTGYSRSGVQITNQQAGPLYTATYTESGDLQTDLNRFASTTDGVLDAVHSLRNTNTADVVVFMVDGGSYCGLANAIGATSSTAFAVVKRSCAVGNYSFGHEIGHLQGARHDPANDPTNTPLPYAHGYADPAGGYRTIMAYPCPSGACPRLNYWSNPSILFNGKALGNTTRSDNARVLNGSRSTIAGFR